ncbi:MAG: YfhO family protein, partial [Actinobacteria bacterium]|nr:YfhO family protein [Actinomycetota bacterium]
ELDLAYRAEKVGPLPWRAIVTAIVPDAFGNPAEKVFYGARNYVEINAFAGATVVVLAVAGFALGASSRVPRWARWFLAGAIAVCVGLIFVGGPPLTAFQSIPVLGENGIGRLRSLLALLVALQAGVGVDALVRAEQPYRRVVALGVGLAVLGMGAALVLGSVAATAEAAGRADYFGRQLVLPGVAAVLAVLLVLAATLVRRPEARVVLVGLLGLLVAVESVTFARSFLPVIDRELFYPETPTHAFLAAELGDDRFAVDGYTMVPGSTVVYGLRSATAHTLTPATYADLLTAVDPTALDRSRTYPLFRPTPTLPSSPVLDRMGVRYVVTDPGTAVAGSTEVVATATGQQEVGAGEELTAEVPAGELRAVRLELRAPVAPAAATELVVELVDADGTVLGTGRRRVLDRTPPGPVDVAFAPLPDPVAPGPWTVRVRVEADTGGLVLATSAPDTPAVSLVRPTDDGLAVAFADGSVVYARGRSLPRFRWAGRALVEPSADERLELLAGGALAPDVVLLSADPAEPGVAPVAPAAGELPPPGPPATVDVRDAGGDELHVVVDAPEAGWLVVADTIQDGWVAEVDGAPVALEDADHAFVAVAVPAGTSDVRLRYVPRGWRTGVAVSGLAALALLAAGLSGWRRRPSGPDRPRPPRTV